MATRATWRPYTEHGDLSKRDQDRLPGSVFAFPEKRKEPLTDARHVRTALARFDQVEGVSDKERNKAFVNIRKAAQYYHVNVEEANWHALGKRPHGKSPARAKRTRGK